MKYTTTFLLLVLTIIASAQPFSSQIEWENYFKSKNYNLDPIEGIWSESNTAKFYDWNNNVIDSYYNQQVGTCAIYKAGNKYVSYDIEQNSKNSKSYINFTNSASSGLYLMEINFKNSYSTGKANAVLAENGLLKFFYEIPTAELKYRYQFAGVKWVEGTKETFDHQWIKIFPSKTDLVRTQPSSGTGFGISSNGYIATCYHVIAGANKIKVKGVNGNFNVSYNLIVLSTDVNNDLAILKIEDATFTSLGIIPYRVKSASVDVGSNIFILGYPLRATMGDEIKLTNGIVSAKSGFKGDITSYQLSASAQPGNSGGPLFDNLGNLIGVVNAKHVEADNATYAVKSAYLVNLIESLSTTLILQTVSNLANKALPDQVKSVKNFVYIIEVE